VRQIFNTNIFDVVFLNLLILKSFGIINISWVSVFAPYWLPGLCILASYLILCILDKSLKVK